MSANSWTERPNAGRTPLRAGALAGALVGFLWSIGNAAGGLAISRGFGLQAVTVAGYSLSVANYLFAEAIVGAMILALLGMLLVKIERFLPSPQTPVKGIEVMLLVWIISRGLATLLELRVLLSITLSLWTLATYLLAGAALGYLVRKFNK